MTKSFPLCLFQVERREAVSYKIETNDKYVRNLMSMSGSPPEIQFVQIITGAYVTDVDSLETVVYTNSEVEIHHLGYLRLRIGQVNELILQESTSHPFQFHSMDQVLSLTAEASAFSQQTVNWVST